MGILKDIELKGKHAAIVRSLNENKLYNSFADVLTEAMLIGLYHGKKSEVDSVESDSELDKVNISFRTYFGKRQDLEQILVTFLQHEKLYQQHLLSTEEVFLLDETSPNATEILDELKSYGLYGIEVLGEQYKEILNTVNLDVTIDELLKNRLLTKHELVEVVTSDDKDVFYKSFQDAEIDSILRDLK